MSKVVRALLVLASAGVLGCFAGCENAAHTKQIAELQAQVDAAVAQAAETEKVRADLEFERDKAQVELKDLQTAIEAEKGRVAGAASERTQLMEAVDKEKALALAAMQEKVALEEQLAAQKAALDAKNAEVVAAKAAVTAKDQEQAKMADALATAKFGAAEAKTAKEELIATKKTLEEAQANSQKMASDLESAKKVAGEQAIALEEAKSEIDVLSKKVADLTEQLKKAATEGDGESDAPQEP